MSCQSFAEHRLSSPRVAGVGRDLLGRFFRTMEQRCEFPDCGRVFRQRVYGADPVPGDVLEHLTTAGGES